MVLLKVLLLIVLLALHLSLDSDVEKVRSQFDNTDELFEVPCTSSISGECEGLIPRATDCKRPGGLGYKLCVYNIAEGKYSTVFSGAYTPTD
jgi:hypothetical protein